MTVADGGQTVRPNLEDTPMIRCGPRPAVLAVAGLLVLGIAAGPARAGGKFLGETVLYVGDGGHEAWMIGQSQDVGFKYNYVAFLWVDLWSWGGTYCVHQRFEHKYVPITPAEAARLLKRDEADVQSPFWYRYPAGLFIVIPLAGVGAIRWVIRQMVRPAPVEPLPPTEPTEPGTP